jgi:sulfur transfer protein SufE
MIFKKNPFYMSTSCREKQNEIKALFAACSTEDEKYKKIIEMGKKLPKLKADDKTSDNIVKGCQSTMYLRSFMREGLVYFEADSEALISAGLASILIHVYNGETPETILTCPPTFLDDLGLSASLSPSRSSGLYSVHLRMKQDALKFLTNKA